MPGGSRNTSLVYVKSILSEIESILGELDSSNCVFGIFNTGVTPIGEPLGDAYFVDGSVSASGDGTTWATAVQTIDESIALCTANQNDSVFVSPGQYDEDANVGGVLVDVAGIHLFGLGKYECQVRNPNASATAVFTVSVNHIEIAGFNVNEMATTVEGIYCTQNALHVHDCIFNNTQENAIHLAGSVYCIIEHNRIVLSTDDGIELSGFVTDNLILENYITGVGDNAIHLNGGTASRNYVIGNVINGSNGTTDQGIHLNGADGNTVVRNAVGGCVTAGLDSGNNNVKRMNEGDFGWVLAYPLLAGPIRCTGGVGAWVMGAYVPIIAVAALTDYDIVGIQFLVNSATSYIVRIGVGAPGSEVAKTEFPTATQVVNTEYDFILNEPLRVRSGSGLAVACATLAGLGSEWADCKVLVNTNAW